MSKGSDINFEDEDLDPGDLVEYITLDKGQNELQKEVLAWKGDIQVETS